MIKLPLILSDRGDVSVFETVRDIERYVESPDAAEYRVYDAAGQRYFFKGYRQPSKGKSLFQRVDCVQLDLESPGPLATDELVQVLRSYLARRKRRETGAGLSLNQLVERTIALSGYTR
jgi:hypothetical protein